MCFFEVSKAFFKIISNVFFLQISVFRPKNTFKKHCLVFKLLITFHGKSIDDVFFSTGLGWSVLGIVGPDLLLAGWSAGS